MQTPAYTPPIIGPHAEQPKEQPPRGGQVPPRPHWFTFAQGRTTPESGAFGALRWLLNVTLSSYRIGISAGPWPWPLLLVDSADTVGVAFADHAAALFRRTGAFTQADAQRLVGRPLAELLTPPVAEPVLPIPEQHDGLALPGHPTCPCGRMMAYNCAGECEAPGSGYGPGEPGHRRAGREAGFYQ